MKIHNPSHHLQIALKPFALGLAVMAALAAGAGLATRAQALTYDFNDATLQGWHNRVWDGSTWIDLAPNATTYAGTLLPASSNNGLFVPGSGAVWVSGSTDGHLNTLWLRSPQFHLAATGDLTVQLAKGVAHTTWTAPMNDSAVPFAATNGTGWMGVALRTVSDNKFVLLKPKTSGGNDSYYTTTFTQAELAPYLGVACTLDLINADNGSWGWITMDNVTIPGDTSLPGTGKDILSFTFPTYGAAAISGTNISVTVPYGTAVTALAPTYTLSSLATCDKASGSTQNFSGPVHYVVTAADLSTQDYTVTVNITPVSTAKDMLTFGPGATISGTNITWTVPYGTDLTSLAPTYTVSTFATGTPFTGTSLDFTTPQTYTITAQDGSTQSYTVAATLLPDLPAAINVNYTGGANASMNGIYSNDATARGTASRVAPAEYGGNFWNDFGNPAATGSNLKDSKGVASGVELTTSMAGGPWADWNGLGGARMLISGVICSYTSYTPILALTGLNPAHSYDLYIASLHSSANRPADFRVGTVVKSVANNPSGSTNWTEGKNYVRFTSLTPPVGGTLVVEAHEGATDYMILNGFQLVDTTPQCDIISFTFPTHGAATISGTGINITVPYGTNVAALAPTYTLSYGATCAPASGSSQNFTSPVHYLVTASDNSTKDYTVTVNVRSIADPEFTLTAPANWDGRQTITVQSTITNWDLLSTTGGTNVNYNWNVGGVAASKQITPGTLTLTRAQGNGPMTVTLVMDNGGWPVSHAVTVNVQQPASDAWVQRTPDAIEKPEDGQFFARDDTGFGKIYYNGTQSGTPDTVYLKVYTTQTGTDVPYASQSQALVGGAYSFAVPVAAGLYKYKVVYGTTTGGTDTPRATVSNLVCGDAYIVQGQSNAEASSPNNGTPPEANYYSSEWIRSYGNSYNGTVTGGWGTALRTRTWGSANYGQHQIGAWGIDLAKQLLERHNMPICIMNGAVGGTRIDQHLRNEANHQDTATIYGRLLKRIEAAKLTHGIRGVLWHQGEQDQGREGPYAGDFDYKWYQQNFVDLSAAWKQDFPNIQNYYIYQIWPAACGDTSANDMLRETQRTLPALYSNMRIMSTLGVEPGASCHYGLDGYQMIAELMRPQVEQDHYGRIPDATETFAAPDLKSAWFTTAARNEIALEFDQDMYWPITNDPKDYFYLDGVAGKVATGSVSGKVIKLQLTAASTAKTITYLKGGWDGTQTKLLRSAKGIEITGIDINGNNGTQRTVTLAALTFAEVPIALTAPGPEVVPFVSWIATKGLPGSAGDADPDHDSIPNALEYVLGGEPNPATAGSNSAALLPTSAQDTGDLVFTFRRKDASEGAVNLTFQWSTDLTFAAPNEVPVGSVSSTSGGITVAVTENSPDAATDTIVITVPAAKAAGGGKLFGRLHATVP